MAASGEWPALEAVAAVDFWSVLLTVVVAFALALVLGISGDEGGKAAPTVTSKRERRHLKQLVLPDEAVKEKAQAPSEPQPLLANTRFRAVTRAGNELVELVERLKRPWARTPWDQLSLDAEATSGHRPLLVFVNSRSGGGQGVELLRELQTLLHRLQVVDLREESPNQALQWWSQTGQRFRILVCGGDGTVGWILTCLEELQPEYMPPVAILPVGTGNDLARVMGWGGGFGGGSVAPILQKVSEGHAAYLDRWRVVCRDLAPLGRPKGLPASERKSMIMCNYLGVGVDAAVALDFHQMRERRPHLFVSRLVNKVWYVKSGTLNPLRNLCKDIASNITLECDGRVVQVPSTVEGIVVLNINSFGGGCDLWGEASDDETESDDDNSDERADASPDKNRRRSVLRRSLSQVRPSMQDQQLEVVGVHGSFQLGAAQVGLYAAQRLAQAKTIRITTKAALPMQVDGEPVLFARDGEIEISYKGQALMLAKRATNSHAVATDVIDWALEKRHISVEQRNILMREISRRAQSGALTAGRTASLPNLMAGL